MYVKLKLPVYIKQKRTQTNRKSSNENSISDIHSTINKR